MTERIYWPQPILPQSPVSRSVDQKVTDRETAFAEILSRHTLKFSRHAQERICQRGIPLDSERLRRIQDAVDKAAAKGAKDSLILVDNLAFVVSVKNRTVVTAMEEASIRGNVFTNIDSAVII